MSPAAQNARARYARNRKIASLAALFAMLALIAGALAIAGTAGSGTSSSTSTTGTATTLPVTTSTIDPSRLTPVAQAAYALMQQGRAAGYHVVYAISGSALPATTIAASLEVWRSGPLVRHDTRVSDSSGERHTVDIGGPAGTVACTEQAGPSYTCRRESTAPVGDDSDFLGFVIDLLATATVDAHDDTVIGMAVRCFEFTAPRATAELCMTPAGVPLRVTNAGFIEQATTVEQAVNPSVFDPPAPVT